MHRLRSQTILWSPVSLCPRRMCQSQLPTIVFKTRFFSTGRLNTFRYIMTWRAMPTYNSNRSFLNVISSCARKILKKKWIIRHLTSRSNWFIARSRSSLLMAGVRRIWHINHHLSHRISCSTSILMEVSGPLSLKLCLKMEGRLLRETTKIRLRWTRSQPLSIRESSYLRRMKKQDNHSPNHKA